MNTLAAISVILGILSAIVIALDIVRHSQTMKIMSAVWILTGLWGGAFALAAYFWFGRVKRHEMPQQIEMSHEGMNMDTMVMPAHAHWQSVTLSTLHCGAGCTLADLIGEWFLYFVAVTIGGSLLLGSVLVDYLLALLIGVYFQYSAIHGMSSASVGSTLCRAFKVDVLSLTAWQVGMYGFMAVVIFVLMPGEPLLRNSWLFWFMMQIAMLIGFVLAYPVNVLLIKYGVKKAM